MGTYNRPPFQAAWGRDACRTVLPSTSLHIRPPVNIPPQGSPPPSPPCPLSLLLKWSRGQGTWNRCQDPPEFNANAIRRPRDAAARITLIAATRGHWMQQSGIHYICNQEIHWMQQTKNWMEAATQRSSGINPGVYCMQQSGNQGKHILDNTGSGIWKF